MNDLLVFFAATILVTIVLARAVKIVSESERIAVFNLGRFQAIKGPGLILIAPEIQKGYRLKVGDIGVLAGSEIARFGTVDIPVNDVGALRQGQAVRIDGFDGVVPRLVASSVSAQTTCPSCGHQF